MIIKTAEDIFANATWPRPNQLVFELFSPMLERKLRVSLYFDPSKEKKEIRPLTLKSIQEFQQLPKESIAELYDVMWKHLLEMNKPQPVSHDGGKTWTVSTLEQNLDYQGIRNKAEAIRKSPITGVGFVNEDDDIDHTYFNIFMNPEWDEEHGLTGYYYHGKLDFVE